MKTLRNKADGKTYTHFDLVWVGFDKSTDTVQAHLYPGLIDHDRYWWGRTRVRNDAARGLIDEWVREEHEQYHPGTHCHPIEYIGWLVVI